MTSLPSPLVLPLLLALGCRPPDTAPKPQDTGTPTPPVDTADTAVPMDSGDTALPEDTAVLPDYDCDALFAEDIENNAIDWARAYHDTVFDLEGNLIGLDGGTGLVKSTYDGQRNLWVPGIVSAEGMDRLPDGSIVYANSARGRLDKVTPEGGQETLVSNVNGIKGVTVGPDGNIYYASGGVFRYDVLTEEVSTLLEAIRTGELTIATGERAVAVGGSVEDTVIITGDGNVVFVFKGVEAGELWRILTRPQDNAPRLPPEVPRLHLLIGREAEKQALLDLYAQVLLEH